MNAHNTPRCSQPGRRAESGFMLLDVLVAILVFSLGVLTVVSLQTTSVRLSSQAKYRADATLLANDLISRMWVSDRQFATLNDEFATGGAGYETWLATVEATLPGASANPPDVTVVQVAGGGGGAALPSSRITVVLRWKPPSAPAADPANNLTVVTQIK